MAKMRFTKYTNPPPPAPTFSRIIRTLAKMDVKTKAGDDWQIVLFEDSSGRFVNMEGLCPYDFKNTDELAAVIDHILDPRWNPNELYVGH